MEQDLARIDADSLDVEQLLALAPDQIPQYVRTPAEQQAVNDVDRRAVARGLAPKWYARKASDGSYIIGPVHEDPQVGRALAMQALGTTSPSLLSNTVQNLVNLSRVDGEVSERRLNQLLATVRAIGPQDELETLLAAQMAAVHDASMASSMRLANAESIEQRESAQRGLAKLTRTFAMQVEALKRHRGKGEQRVVVEHQHVHLHQGSSGPDTTSAGSGEGRGLQKIGDQSHVRRFSECSPVLGEIEAERSAVPRARDEGQERLPVSRRKGRRAVRQS